MAAPPKVEVLVVAEAVNSPVMDHIQIDYVVAQCCCPCQMVHGYGFSLAQSKLSLPFLALLICLIKERESKINIRLVTLNLLFIYVVLTSLIYLSIGITKTFTVHMCSCRGDSYILVYLLILGYLPIIFE